MGLQQLRQLVFPGQRVGDDGVEVLEAGLPVERRVNTGNVSHQGGRIARAPPFDLDREIDAADLLTMSITSITEKPRP